VQGAKWWLVSYDVRDEKRLRRVARHMEGYGERLQYSLFRCWLTPREAEKVRWELTQIAAAEDDVLFIPLCGRCHDGVRVTHQVAKRPDWPPEPGRFEIV
jgi:CRISPR-associated protein Cas2